MGVVSCARHEYAPVAVQAQAIPDWIGAGRLEAEAHRELLERYGLRAEDRWPPSAWSIPQLALLAAERSRELRAAKAAVHTAIQQRTVAGLRPNPRLELTVEHHSQDERGTGSEWSVGPSIEFLWTSPRKRELRLAVAKADIVAAYARALEAAWQARRRLYRSSLAGLRQAERKRLLAEHVARVEQAVTIARRRAAAGLADDFEWQSLSLSLSSAKLAALEHAGRFEDAVATLAAALNVAPARVADIAIDPPAPVELPDASRLQRMMLQRHPALVEAMADYDRAEHELALAVAEQYPDLNVAPGYFFDQGDDVWSIVGGLVLPLFADQSAPIAAAEAARGQARARFEAVQAEAVTALQRAYARAEALRQVLREAAALLRDTQAERDTLARRLEEGAVNRLTVVRADIHVATMALDVARIRARYREALYELEFSARSALFDTAFGRYLDDLGAELGIAGPPEAE